MQYFNLHTHRSANICHDTIELVNQYPHEFNNFFGYYSIGIHPWHIVEERLAIDFAIIKKQLQDPNCLALGECGLDKRIETPFDIQISIFEQQLALAQQYNKPVVIHCVAAFEEVIAIRKKMKLTVPCIIHGFSKNEKVAQSLLSNGFYISFGKYLLQNPALEAVFRQVPEDRFFLETDTIQNGIEAVYDLAAKYKNMTVNQLQIEINKNVTTVFKIT